MTTLTNSLHQTSTTIRAEVGDTVSPATIRRVRKALCGTSDCQCSGKDGTRNSRYVIQEGTLRDMWAPTPKYKGYRIQFTQPDGKLWVEGINHAVTLDEIDALTK